MTQAMKCFTRMMMTMTAGHSELGQPVMMSTLLMRIPRLRFSAIEPCYVSLFSVSISDFMLGNCWFGL